MVRLIGCGRGLGRYKRALKMLSTKTKEAASSEGTVKRGGGVRYGSWFRKDELDFGIEEVRATTRSTAGVFSNPRNHISDDFIN